MLLTLLPWLNMPGTVRLGSLWGASPTSTAYALVSDYLDSPDRYFWLTQLRFWDPFGAASHRRPLSVITAHRW